MNTSNLLKISVVVALVCLVAIIILAVNVEPKITSIKDINEKMLDDWVKIRGQVTSEKDFQGLVLLDVKDDSGSITAVIRKNANYENKAVEIIGKVTDYKGQVEIEASKIKTQT